MILHHVADGPRLIIEGSAALDAKVLRHGDLHALHVMAVPERLEERVGKSKEQHVVHGLFPQIMINSENVPLLKTLEQNAIQPLRGRAVGAKRFLHDDARSFLGTARSSELL